MVSLLWFVEMAKARVKAKARRRTARKAKARAAASIVDPETTTQATVPKNESNLTNVLVSIVAKQATVLLHALSLRRRLSVR